MYLTTALPLRTLIVNSTRPQPFLREEVGQMTFKCEGDGLVVGARWRDCPATLNCGHYRPRELSRSVAGIHFLSMNLPAFNRGRKRHVEPER